MSSVLMGLLEATLGSAFVYQLAIGSLHGWVAAAIAGALFWFSLLNLLDEARR